MKTTKYSLGIVGVRGYVGQELITLLLQHEQLDIEWVSSRKLEGQPVLKLISGHTRFNEKLFKSEIIKQQLNLSIESLSPEEVANKETEIIVLALPNGLARPYVEALNNRQTTRLVIDISADYRFDNSWLYSVPELHEQKLLKSSAMPQIKISNPGCYATAMQLAIAPLVNNLVEPVHCFGVSGYSGAGTTPSKYNDPDELNNNLIPYKLVEHLHEKEVTDKLRTSVRFTPHVAAFFRGINLTIQMEMIEPLTTKEIIEKYLKFYSNYSLVKIKSAIPTISDIVGTTECHIGGFTVTKNRRYLTLVCCLDNLLKGAASQAIQNINLALGLPWYQGIYSDQKITPSQIQRSEEHKFIQQETELNNEPTVSRLESDYNTTCGVFK